MAIERVEIQDFLVFKGEFAADFCPGINVLIGNNGTGKTSIMKIMYMACDLSKIKHNKVDLAFADKSFYLSESQGDISEIFLKVPISPYFPNIDFSQALFRCVIDKEGNIIDKVNPLEFTFICGEDEAPGYVIYGVKDSDSFVYIPTNDMLSHSEGFLALNNERKLPFDETFVDILSKAELPVTREITPVASKILDKIKRIIGGEVIYKNNIFYIVGEQNNEIPITLEASGHRKLGLLWKLLRNGLLEKGTVLFWDEPENSLNPELMPDIVDILLELSRNGVQMFLATHSEIFADYISVNKQNDDSIMFYSLYKKGEQVKVDSNDRFDLLNPNKLTEEPVRLYEKKLERGLNDE